MSEAERFESEGVVIDVREQRGAGSTQVYMTATVMEGTDAALSASAAYGALSHILAEKSISTMQEKIFGSLAVKDAILASRQSALEEKGLANDRSPLYLEGKPVRDVPFAGVQIWGVVPHPESTHRVVDIELPLGLQGRQWEGDHFRMIHVPAMTGLRPGMAPSQCITEQADDLWQIARSCLKALDMPFSKVFRTWIYLGRILDWYGEFNRVRTRHFREILPQTPTGMICPASTGIQGRAGAEECLMDMLILDQDRAATPAVEPILTTPRQQPAPDYGSSFSRGMLVSLDDCRTIYVSGTASIDSTGATIYLNEAEAQCFETLMNVASLLESRGSSLSRISSATLYCTSREVFDAYQQVIRLLDVPRFPTLSVIADVCRSDLLVELEAVAAG